MREGWGWNLAQILLFPKTGVSVGVQGQQQGLLKGNGASQHSSRSPHQRGKSWEATKRGAFLLLVLMEKGVRFPETRN